MQHNDRESAALTAQSQVSGTVTQQAWMTACFLSDPATGEVICHRTSFNFPTDKLGQAIQSLINAAQPRELPPALPRVDLFPADVTASPEPEETPDGKPEVQASSDRSAADKD